MASTDTEDLGISIKRCTEFIGSVHAETQVLLLEFSGKIQDAGFEPLRGTVLQAFETSTKNVESPVGWCHRAIARCFGDGGRSPSKQFITVEVHFAPSFSERAVLLLGYAQFAEAQARDALWDGYWEWWMADHYAEHTLEFGVVSDVKSGNTPQVFQHASVLRVIAWPLTSFDSPEKVQAAAGDALTLLRAAKTA